jgi:hypothetical protein
MARCPLQNPAVDLRKDGRTARAYAFGNGVSPTKDIALRVLDSLGQDETALLISGGRSHGFRAGALVVTGQRVLLVPPAGEGPVDEMSRRDVSGAVATRAGTVRVALRCDTEPHTRLLDRVPTTVIEELRRVLPRLETVAGPKEVQRWAARPPRRQAAGSRPERPWASSRTASETRTTTTERPAPRAATTTRLRETARETEPRMRPTASPDAPVSLSGGPPVRTWQDAEVLAAVTMVHLGFADATVTAAGKDQGVDVVARGAVAQVKNWQSTVGAPAVRDLFGTATAAGAAALFFSLSGYTAEARSFAQRAGVCLFTYTTGGKVVAASPSARAILIEAITRLADPVEQRRLQAERTAFEATAQDVERLVARARSLTDVAKRIRRTVRGRAAAKRYQRALDSIQSAANALAALDDEHRQSRREALVRSASGDLRRAAKELGVK